MGFDDQGRSRSLVYRDGLSTRFTIGSNPIRLAGERRNMEMAITATTIKNRQPAGGQEANPRPIVEAGRP